MVDKNIDFENIAKMFNSSRKRASADPEIVKKQWEEGFSSPQSYGQKQFRLLVHGIQGDGARAVQHMALIQQHGFNNEHHVDLLQSPQRIASKKLISCSIIDQDHRGTFGDAGFILCAPFDNIMAMSPEDRGTDFFKPDETHGKMSTNRQHMYIDALLGSTNTHQWNEVVLSGITEAGKVEIIGAFVKTDRQGTPIDPETADKVKRAAYQIGVPVIDVLQPTSEHLDKNLQILKSMSNDDAPYAFAFNRGGTRYLISFSDNKGNEVSRFSTIDDTFRMHPMTKTQAEFTLGVIKDELSDQDREHFAAIIQRLEHQKPTSDPVPVTAPMKNGAIGYLAGFGDGIKSLDTYFNKEKLDLWKKDSIPQSINIELDM